MSLYRQHRTKVRTAIATVTSVSGALDEVIAAQSRQAIGIVQLIASNQLAGVRDIAFYDGSTRLTPFMALGASGTLILDEVGGEQLELSIGSGLFASSSAVGSDTQVSVYYVLHDESIPITKSAARAASLQPIGRHGSVRRTPNRIGGQTES